MRDFRFCPSCGSEIEEPTEKKSSSCASCGQTWYRNPAPTVGVVLLDQGDALITRRGSEPMKDRFDIPGGFLDAGESPLEGLRRELREELGVEIEVSEESYLGGMPHRYGPNGDWVLALSFAGRIASGEPRPSDDVVEIRWTRLEDLDDVDFAWDHNREDVRRALQREQDQER